MLEPMNTMPWLWPWPRISRMQWSTSKEQTTSWRTCSSQEEPNWKPELLNFKATRDKTERPWLKLPWLDNNSTSNTKPWLLNTMMPLLLSMRLSHSSDPWTTPQWCRSRSSTTAWERLKPESDLTPSMPPWSKLWLPWLPARISQTKDYSEKSLPNLTNSELQLLMPWMTSPPPKLKMSLPMKKELRNWMLNSLSSEDKLLQLPLIWPLFRIKSRN